ncbi:hypothetical protein ACWKSP_22200 [Micromonosporaceae bacterium Da 78-11]
MTDIHALDQLLAGADEYLSGFVGAFQSATTEYGESENLRLLIGTLTDLEAGELAPILAAAIRRLAQQLKP